MDNGVSDVCVWSFVQLGRVKGFCIVSVIIKYYITAHKSK